MTAAEMSAQAIDLARKTERIRAVRMIHEALLEWRCVPSKHLREFADQVIAKIEQGEGNE